jgi:hypothetical protein
MSDLLLIGLSRKWTWNTLICILFTVSHGVKRRDWIDKETHIVILVPVPIEYVDPAVKYPGGWIQDGQTSIAYERSPIHVCWAEMEKLVDDKVARNIGVSNFNVMALLDLFTYCRYKPATLQGKKEQRKGASVKGRTD